ncbi:hypothetical protein MAM1_0254d08787 [Mucor ambiguus]|uniref:PH domain-containing protein n=1 Tax=Mucor ambiguus TaxID=91626 RepID=A0A0C9N054_9FUNG|nr:hypothetical protein MAM1_0254d08787 [Mucor ambiguus]
MPFLSSLDRNEEVPVTSTPIFEGHLSIRTEKKHWQWRLFRFDGSNFTCLSTRKIKLPPNHSTSLKSTESNYSLTSPLLATPKDKSKRLVESSKTELKYYQLPEWTIDVANISAISVLKRAKKNALQQSSSKCFSIRTFDQKYYILKAQKQKDLERWLFVLTKMWKFTQTVKNQVQQLQQQQQQQQFYYPTLSNATAAVAAAAAAHQVAQVQAQAQQVQQQQQAAVQAAVDDNIPLVHSIQQFPKPPALSDEKIKVIEEWRKSLAELMASDPCIKVSTPPPIEPIPDDDTMSVFTDMTSVSNRPKSMKRRGNSKRSVTSRSLRRNKTNSIAPAGAASSSNQHQEMPLEGRPGPTLRKRRSDDVRNWMNNGSSNSNGRQTPVLNRAASTSSRRRKPIIQKLSTTDLYQQVPLNNYYNNNQYYYNANCQLNSSTSPEIIQHMNFFQDVITVCDEEVCPYEHQQQDDNKLRYHTSVRGKKLIQVNQGEDPMPAGVAGAVGGRSECKDEGDANPCNENVQLKIEEKQQQQQQQCAYTEQGEQQDELGGELRLTSSPNQDNINIMTRPTIITRRASMPLTDDNLLIQQQYQQQYQQYQQQQQYLFDKQKMNALSPLQFLSLTATKKELEKYKSASHLGQNQDEAEEEEEDMSLADLQKSLRQVGLQQQHTRSPSASSIQDLQKRSSRYMNNPSIVAPAIPPHQYIQQQQQQFRHHPQQQQLYLFDYDQQKQLKQQQHQIQQQYHQQQNLKMFLPSTSSSHQQQHPHHYSSNIYP